MKTLEQIVQSCISSVQGGQFTDESNMYTGKIEEKVHEVRNNFIREKYIQNNQVHPDWIQRFYPEYDEFMQEDKCVTTFECPRFVDLGTRDGLIYVGSSDYPQSFGRAYNIGDLSTMMSHPIYNRERITVLYENGRIYIYSKQRIISPMVSGVFARPTDLKSYNKFYDNYPLDPHTCMLVENAVVQVNLMNEIRTPVDDTSDSSTPSLTAGK